MKKVTNASEKHAASAKDKRALLQEFFDGPGFPGISKLWRGRDAIYDEREEELVRRREKHRSQVK
jgi:hypothetical protein